MGLIKFNFFSHTLSMQTNVTIVLPTLRYVDTQGDKPCVYVKGTKFQTMFLLHGAAGDDSDWCRYTSVERYAEDNKLAVVMPSVCNSFYTDTTYRHRYWTYVSKELPNLVRAMFPLSDKREDNFVAGLSMGGHGAMAFAIKRPEMFSTAVCLSGASIRAEDIQEFAHRVNGFMDLESVFGNLSNFSGSQNDIWHIAKINSEKGKELPRFYFAVGTDDMGYASIKNASRQLEKLGYPVTYEEEKGYGHEWDFWDMYIRKAIEEWLPLRREPLYP
jgi:putative tributyrin esterase